jgi:catalase
VQPVGLLTLTGNPTNYFAETEQVAFHPGNLVPGIDVTDDPLLAARLFSYIDTQITRLGGPNFGQLPINRPHVPVNDMLRDGMHQTAVHTGVAPYRPNSLDGGCPFTAGAAAGGYVEVPQALPASTKVRASPASFADHFSQPRLFFRSLSPVEQQHVIEAYTFELAKCYEPVIRQRQLLALAAIDADLCAGVAAGLGLEPPSPPTPPADVEPSPALSQTGREWPVTGRQIGILAGPASDPDAIAAAATAIAAAGMTPLVIADSAASLGTEPTTIAVSRILRATRSIEYDAILVAAGREASPLTDLMLSEAFRHAKAIGSWGDGDTVIDHAGCPADAAGVVSAAGPDAVVAELTALLAKHRVWERVQS